MATVNGPVQLNTHQSFGTTDNISNITSEVIYYRLKVTGKAGEIKYSNIVVVRLQKAPTDVTVMPNPAKDFVSVRFYVEKDSKVTLRLVDFTGKIVLQQTKNAIKGENTIQVNELNKLSNAVYTIQVLVNNEIVNRKLIINK